MNRPTKNRKKVTRLSNDYTHERTLKAKKIAQSRRNVRRRLTVSILLGGVLIGAMTSRVFGNMTRSEVIQLERQSAEAELKDIEELNRNLQNRVTQLQNPDFVAKLARSRYYLSKDGEIIFRIPAENGVAKDSPDGVQGNSSTENNP